jgi:N-acetylglutamate synthase-like GNAT family acetyltransferase
MQASVPTTPPPAAAIRAATAGDLPAVMELLAAVSLPLAGLADFFPAGYAVAVGADQALVGVAGVEVHGREGLLRSVAVAPAAGGRGIGAALVRDRVAWAHTAGLAGVHLLTEDAASFFARLGFETRDRADLPAGIRASVLFVKACPETVAAMSLSLSDPAESPRESAPVSGRRTTPPGQSAACASRAS